MEISLSLNFALDMSLLCPVMLKAGLLSMYYSVAFDVPGNCSAVASVRITFNRHNVIPLESFLSPPSVTFSSPGVITQSVQNIGHPGSGGDANWRTWSRKARYIAQFVEKNPVSHFDTLHVYKHMSHTHLAVNQGTVRHRTKSIPPRAGHLKS